MNEIYVEVIDSAAVRQRTSLQVNGLKLHVDEWKRYDFFPNKGVVGQVMGEAQSREGIIYLVQFSEHIMAAILPRGLKQISKAEAQRRYSQNRTIGKFDDAQSAAAMTNEILGSFGL